MYAFMWLCVSLRMHGTRRRYATLTSDLRCVERYAAARFWMPVDHHSQAFHNVLREAALIVEALLLSIELLDACKGGALLLHLDRDVLERSKLAVE